MKTSEDIQSKAVKWGIIIALLACFAVEMINQLFLK